MKLLVGVTSYRLHESDLLLKFTKRCLASVNIQETTFPVIAALFDQRSSYSILEGLQALSPKCYIYTEIGDCVSRSWNLLCEHAFQIEKCSHALILNNDIALFPGAIEPLQSFASENPNCIITSPEVAGFSVFLISKDIYGLVGPFDENLKGGSLEDWDYTIRMKDKDVKCLPCPDFKVIHEHSATKDIFVNNLKLQKLRDESLEYYRKKWARRDNLP